MTSYTCHNMLIKHKQNCEQPQEITSIRTSDRSQTFGKNHFHKNPLFFSIYADFEADTEIDISSIGNETTNILKKNPVCNGYIIISVLEDVLESRYYSSNLDCNNVDCFVHEVIKIENKLNFYIKKTKKDIMISKEDEEDFKINTTCRFCEKEIVSDKVRDPCHLTGKYRGPAHHSCNINVKQKDSNFIVIIFTILVFLIVICTSRF